MPKLYIISGCNGAGKTTASYSVLPDMLDCKEFVNADEIAKGLSPFQPENVAIAAGRIMLSRIKELMKQNVDFAFETTLSSKTYKHLVAEAKANGYFVTLLFFWLDSVDLAIERVKIRVSQGGHNIQEEIIRRRYASGLENLSKIYLPICDYWMIYDNSNPPSSIIAEGFLDKDIEVYKPEIFNQIISK
ncbi:MAG: zeta toxin family protein [Prolixibacteraceae bacterium]|nr:zeta toxin family protein [Prolixibacteraceae bacterium]